MQPERLRSAAIRLGIKKAVSRQKRGEGDRRLRRGKPGTTDQDSRLTTLERLILAWATTV